MSDFTDHKTLVRMSPFLVAGLMAKADGLVLEEQRVSVCAGGVQARCSVLVWLARRAAAARVEDAGLWRCFRM